MSKGKYQNRATRVHKRPGILLISLVMLLVVIVGGSMAFLQDATNKVENTFTPAQVTIDPTESVDHTENTKSNIKFTNTGNVPVYIRATLVIYWTDVIDGKTEVIAQPTGAEVKIGAVQSGWTKVEEIYYYTSPVNPGTHTGVMLAPINVAVPTGSTAQCHIDVQAEAIQADGLGSGVTTAQAAWAATKAVQGVG